MTVGTCFAIFIFGPALIHTIYRVGTRDAVIAERRVEYHRLADAELAMDGDALLASQETRYRLALWFRARGLNIDEGHDEGETVWRQLLRPWKVLAEYWSEGE